MKAGGLYIKMNMGARISELPPELQERILYHVYPDLETLNKKGHILVSKSRGVSLPGSGRVRVLAFGGGGGRVRSS